MTTVFETRRLVVRAWTRSQPDLARLYDMYSRWEVVRWLGSVPTPMASPDEAPARVDRFTARSEADGRLGVWAVQVRDSGLVAGTVLLVALSDPGPDADGTGTGTGGGGEVEVGWHLHRDCWGNGYATEVGRGAIEHGFAGGLTEVYAVVRPGNEASLAVCRRLGMEPLGRTRRWYDTELESFRITRPTHDQHNAGS